MGFRSSFQFNLLCGVLLCGSVGWGQDPELRHITVLINDSVGLKRGVLRRAESEADRLFAPARIRIEWRNCGETSDCRRPPRRNEFVLHIVPRGTTRSDFVFGEAFLGPDGQGKYADVFFNRLQQSGSSFDLAQLLGAVSAHELGHLFLGSHAHALVGIMEPLWGPESLRLISMGNLTFTREQEQLMRSRLLDEKMAGASLAGLRSH